MNEIATISSTKLMLDAGAFERATRLAEVMAKSAVTVPQHLRGKPADCLAIIMQAATWGMNPFVVAQKTHIVNGALGYEAQLVNAVIQASGAIKGRFHYEYRGEPGSVECRVGAVLTGETEITWGEWLNERSVAVKNSPLWKTNPKQQLGYLQVKNWARMYAPGAILGIYDADELAAQDNQATIVRDMGTIQSERVQNEKPPYSDDQVRANAEKWAAIIESGRKTADELIATIETKYSLTDEQKAAIRALGSQPSNCELHDEKEDDMGWGEFIAAGEQA